jgi:hypothetical protein
VIADATLTFGSSALSVVIASIPVIGAVYLSRRGTKKELDIAGQLLMEQATRLGTIEIKVDGRLEAALEGIDKLQATLAEVTGVPAPPKVSGQSGTEQPPTTAVE